jgi:hypothetical protein
MILTVQLLYSHSSVTVVSSSSASEISSVSVSVKVAVLQCIAYILCQQRTANTVILLRSVVFMRDRMLCMHNIHICVLLTLLDFIALSRRIPGTCRRWRKF